MEYTTIIGLEIHVQLLTRSKLFCGCANRFNPENPNVQTCPVCLGLPGSLPVLNQGAFRLALKTALALNCNIPPSTKWDRKQYYYPDLPKGYQISQYDLPFSEDGYLDVEVDPQTDESRRVGIIRAHLEEDAGKSLHAPSGRGDSRVDLNRCGTPLIEIVTQPDLRSPREARRFLEEMKLLLRYLGVSDCNMQEGSLRCDANINLHIQTEDGHSIPTPISEVKNLNSFRNVELALEYETNRQLDEWKATGHKLDEVPKETRGWDDSRGVTVGQRSKEEAPDYRYFPDPDLVPVSVTEDWIEEIRDEIEELPAERRRGFRTAYQLSDYDAGVVIDQGKAFADYFEEVARDCGDGKQAANWLTQEVLRELNARGISIDQFPIRPPVLAGLLSRIVAGDITVKSARDVFSVLRSEADGGTCPGPHRVDEIIDEKGLERVTDTAELDGVVRAVVEKNPQAVEDFRKGKQAAVGPLIGQVMREVKGADPKLVREMLAEKMKVD